MEATTTESIVEHPPHYTRYEVEPIEFILRNNLDFCTGNICKYALRAGHKTYSGMDATESAITDLEKVRRYAEMRINMLKGGDIL